MEELVSELVKLIDKKHKHSAKKNKRHHNNWRR